jgi:hypothetical protein
MAKSSKRNGERGVGLFLAVFALLLLTGIAAAMLFTSNTETSVDSNYRNEQLAYFGAKAGVEEARARAMTSDPNTIALPTVLPTTSVPGVFYIVNNTLGAQPWLASNAYADDELCHDGYGTGSLGLTAMPPDVRCVNTSGNVLLPSGSGWYSHANTALPENAPYAWVRIAPKLNDSVTYLTGSGSTATTSTYYVHSLSAVAPVVTAENLICWDGQEEVPLTSGYSLCSQMLGPSNAPMTFVYLATALGTATNGARKVVQAEIALQPTPPFPYGLYATSSSCSAIAFNGSNPGTNSYNGTYPPFLNGGDIGSNGSITVAGATIDGTVGILPPATTGCAVPTGTITGGITYMAQPYAFPAPPAPNPLPPNTSYSPPGCGSGSGSCMTAGTYGNINLNGTLYLAPGIYNLNSFSMQGNGAVIVSPPGAVTFNIAGTGQSNPVKIDGNGITDDSNPNDFTIDYAGSGTVTVKGNGNVTAILNAPNAAVAQSGNGAWYGSMVMATATIGGNAWFHYDQNSALAPNNNGHYTLISYRLVPY